MGRGKKLCQNCNKINGVRSFECKYCGTQFKMKKRRKISKRVAVTDHTILNVGDTIKVIGGSGPYYIQSDGERSYFVDRGIYKVMGTDNNGIVALNDSGYCYLYMGETCASKLLDKIINQACRVVLLKNPAKIAS